MRYLNLGMEYHETKKEIYSFFYDREDYILNILKSFND